MSTQGEERGADPKTLGEGAACKFKEGDIVLFKGAGYMGEHRVVECRRKPTPDTPEKEGMTLEGAKWLEEKYGHLVVVVEDSRLHTDIEEVAIKAVKARSFIEGHASRDREVEGLRKAMGELLTAAEQMHSNLTADPRVAESFKVIWDRKIREAREAIKP